MQSTVIEVEQLWLIMRPPPYSGFQIAARTQTPAPRDSQKKFRSSPDETLAAIRALPDQPALGVARLTSATSAVSVAVLFTPERALSEERS